MEQISSLNEENDRSARKLNEAVRRFRTSEEEARASSETAPAKEPGAAGETTSAADAPAGARKSAEADEEAPGELEELEQSASIKRRQNSSSG
jgi:hypothetical protein